jgi:hypothetical protein
MPTDEELAWRVKPIVESLSIRGAVTQQKASDGILAILGYGWLNDSSEDVGDSALSSTD